MDAIYANAEGHHPANDHPKWSQSYYFNFFDPRTRLGGFLRIGLLENLKQSNMWFVLFKDGKPAYNRICAAAPYTADRMDTGVEVAGLRFTRLDPLKKARIEFADDDCRLSLTFEALCPMADAVAMTRGSATLFAQSVATAHLEGPGRVTGTLVLRGTSIRVDGNGFRDISWGVRDWEAMHHYTLAWPLFTNGQATALIHATSVGGDHAYMKMFFDGTEWRSVGEVEDTVEFADDGMTVKSVAWRFRDSLDRHWGFSGTPIFRFFFPFDGFLVTEHMTEYRLGDGTLGYGVCECGFRLP